MKKQLLFYAILLLALCTGVSANAKIVNEQDHYFCGFDELSEFEQWSKIDLNGMDPNEQNVYRWDEESKSAYFSPGPKFDGNDWLISPAIHLSQGKALVLKINMFCDWPCKLTFAIGKTNTVEGMTEIIAEKNDYDGEFYLCLKLPNNLEGGDYYVGIHNTTLAWKGILYLKSVEVAEDNGGTINVQVKNKETGEPLNGVQTHLTGDFYEEKIWSTNDEGKVVFNDLTPGNYTLFFKKDEFESQTKEIEVKAKQTETLDVELEPKPVTTVKGIVVDEALKPMAGALVKLVGKGNFETQTGEDGSFSIEKVPANKSYKFTVSKDWKLTYKKKLELGKEPELNMDTLILEDLLATPLKVYAENVEKGVFLSWMVPLKEREFALDNGKPLGSYQINSDTYSYVGNTYREPMAIKSVSWLLGSEYPTVDVYVFPFNKDGSISTQPLLAKYDVPSNTYNYSKKEGWSELDLDTTVTAPYGCVVAIGHTGSIKIYADYQTLNGSLVCVDRNFEKSGWFYPSRGNFFIRANGFELTSDLSTSSNIRSASYVKKQAKKTPAKISDSGFSFTVWRYQNKDKDDQNSWEKVAYNVNSLEYIDSSIKNKGKGFYQYAIQAVYPNGKKTDYGYSDLIDHNMHTNVKVYVTTNTAVHHENGAIVTLMNNDVNLLEYKAEIKDGMGTFDKVQKGKYTVIVKKEGFEDAHTDVALNDKDNYSVTLELLLKPLKPYNLQVGKPDTKTDCILSWNNEGALVEDFEDMQDFEVNPQNSKGWTFFDGDTAKTFGVALCKENPYPNMYSPMAFMVFNPFKTTPNLSEFIRPRSGEKILVSVSPETGVRSDDYLFSPELKYESDFKFDFYAAAGFYGSLGNEEFMVGYTVSDPTPENVIWLTKKHEQVGGMWTPFSYTLPKEARHAVIRGVSQERLFFMLDDIKIGITEPEVFNMAIYNVTLDGEELGTTYDRNFNLGKLESGKHIAKVQTTYTMADMSKKYSDFAEIKFTVEKHSGITSVSQTDKLFEYNGELGEIIPCDQVEALVLYDLQGNRCAQVKRGQRISTKQYDKGIYILTVVSKEGTSSHKILLQ